MGSGDHRCIREGSLEEVGGEKAKCTERARVDRIWCIPGRQGEVEIKGMGV